MTESYEDRLARYHRERRETIERLNKIVGDRTIPLSEVVDLLPAHPEWKKP